VLIVNRSSQATCCLSTCHGSILHTLHAGCPARALASPHLSRLTDKGDRSLNTSSNNRWLWLLSQQATLLRRSGLAVVGALCRAAHHPEKPRPTPLTSGTSSGQDGVLADKASLIHFVCHSAVPSARAPARLTHHQRLNTLHTETSLSEATLGDCVEEFSPAVGRIGYTGTARTRQTSLSSGTAGQWLLTQAEPSRVRYHPGPWFVEWRTQYLSRTTISHSGPFLRGNGRDSCEIRRRIEWRSLSRKVGAD